MNFSRQVVAFALLKECSELLRTDLLGGISLLIRPITADLAGQRFNAEELAERLLASYGLRISAQALSDFLPRFIAADLIEETRVSEHVNEARYKQAPTDLVTSSTSDEIEFQTVIDKFIEFCRPHLSILSLQIPEEELISGLLSRLATFDFRSIDVKPDRTARDSSSTSLLLGPTAKEDIELESAVSTSSKIDVLVAAFAADAAENSSALFGLLAKVAEGALGAELVFDLQAPKISTDLSKVTIVLDTPILLSLLDLSDSQQHKYAEELLNQIRESKATPAAFRHSVEEAEGVLAAVKKGVMFGRAYGPTAERLRNRAYLAFFETMIGALERRLIDCGIKIVEPSAQSQYQFFTQDDEEQLAGRFRFHLLERRLARERDAHSVAEIIRLRVGAHVPLERIDSCRFIFITSNSVLQEQARSYLLSRSLIDRTEFSPVITDRSFSGLTWLMFGGTSEARLPTAKLLANCAAALRARPDVIARTMAFLKQIDPKKAEHFEVLMTRERAARYLTEITLGDSLLITADNAEQIYEKIEATAAIKVAREKDEFYGQQISEKKEQLARLDSQLDAATETIAQLSRNSELQGSELRFQEEQISSLSKLLEAEKQESTKREQSLDELRESVEKLETARINAEREALRTKQAAIIRALDKGKERLWLVRISILIVFLAAGISLGYLDKFLTPHIPKELQDSANWILIGCQALLSAVGFWVFTDKFFGAAAFNLATAAFHEDLRRSGYRTCGPEFQTNLRDFIITSQPNDITDVRNDLSVG